VSDITSTACVNRAIRFLQLARAQALGIDARFLCDQPLYHLLVRHFQREDGDMLLWVKAGVLATESRKPVLPCPGASGNDQ